MRKLFAVVAWAVLAGQGCSAPAPQLDGPVRNIVIVTIDTLRADHLGLYGYERDTSPVLDALGAESLVFDVCLTPMAHTLPAHASLFTGLYPDEHGVLANSGLLGYKLVVGPELRTFAQLASARGFRTAAFVSSAAVSKKTGIAVGFDQWDESQSPMRPAEKTNKALFPWLGKMADSHRPFFLWVHYFDPHWPYLPPPPYDEHYENDAWLEAYIAARQIPDEAVRHNDRLLPTRDVINGYDGDVRYVDTELGRVIAALKYNGLWDETALIVTSDHGESLGEHDMLGHLYTYREHLQVPLIMRIPGVEARRVDRPISLTDVIPTALALIGHDGWNDFVAQSTGVNVLEEGRAPEPIFSQRSARERNGLVGPAWSLSTGDLRLIRRPELGDQLYSWERDPFELDNRVDAERADAAALSAALDERLAGQVARAPKPDPDATVDPELLEQLKAIGYAED